MKIVKITYEKPSYREATVADYSFLAEIDGVLDTKGHKSFGGLLKKVEPFQGSFGWIARLSSDDTLWTLPYAKRQDAAEALIDTAAKLWQSSIDQQAVREAEIERRQKLSHDMREGLAENIRIGDVSVSELYRGTDFSIPSVFTVEVNDLTYVQATQVLAALKAVLS